MSVERLRVTHFSILAIFVFWLRPRNHFDGNVTDQECSRLIDFRSSTLYYCMLCYDLLSTLSNGSTFPAWVEFDNYLVTSGNQSTFGFNFNVNNVRFEVLIITTICVEAIKLFFVIDETAEKSSYKSHGHVIYWKSFAKLFVQTPTNRKSLTFPQ